MSAERLSQERIAEIRSLRLGRASRRPIGEVCRERGQAIDDLLAERKTLLGELAKVQGRLDVCMQTFKTTEVAIFKEEDDV